MCSHPPPDKICMVKAYQLTNTQIISISSCKVVTLKLGINYTNFIPASSPTDAPIYTINKCSGITNGIR